MYGCDKPNGGTIWWGSHKSCPDSVHIPERKWPTAKITRSPCHPVWSWPTHWSCGPSTQESRVPTSRAHPREGLWQRGKLKRMFRVERFWTAKAMQHTLGAPNARYCHTRGALLPVSSKFWLFLASRFVCFLSFCSQIKLDSAWQRHLWRGVCLLGNTNLHEHSCTLDLWYVLVYWPGLWQSIYTQSDDKRPLWQNQSIFPCCRYLQESPSWPPGTW